MASKFVCIPEINSVCLRTFSIIRQQMGREGGGILYNYTRFLYENKYTKLGELRADNLRAVLKNFASKSIFIDVEQITVIDAEKITVIDNTYKLISPAI